MIRWVLHFLAFHIRGKLEELCIFAVKGELVQVVFFIMS